MCLGVSKGVVVEASTVVEIGALVWANNPLWATN